MQNPIGKPTQAELLDAPRQCHERAPESEKAKALDEFVAVTGCRRKHAIRLLRVARAAAAAGV